MYSVNGSMGDYSQRPDSAFGAFPVLAGLAKPGRFVITVPRTD